MTWLALGLGLLAALLLASRLYAHNPARPLTTTRDRLPPHDDLADLVERLLAEMSLSEKLEQLSGDCTRRRFEFRYFRSVVVFGKAAPIVYSGENERLGIPPFGFSDGPRGVSTAEGATAFPVTMARGASWDVELERRVGEVMGREALAGGANYSGAVCINLLRHPGWGRAQETYGEDPHHLGQLGLALTRGIQSQGVMACVKHLACNSIENARFRVDVRIDDRALHEVYLPHFKVVVISEEFEGKNLIGRHRLVNASLREEFDAGLHALSIIALTPSQWVERGGEVLASPLCGGGSKSG